VTSIYHIIMKNLLFIFYLVPLVSFGQFGSGKKLEEYKASNNKIYKIGDTVKLGSGSNPGGDFKYVTIGALIKGFNPVSNNIGNTPNVISKKYDGYSSVIKKIYSMNANGDSKTILVIKIPTLIFNCDLNIEAAISSCEIVDCIKPNNVTASNTQSNISPNNAAPIQPQANNIQPNLDQKKTAGASYPKLIKLPDGSPGCSFKLNDIDQTYKLVPFYFQTDTNTATVNKVNYEILDQDNKKSPDAIVAGGNYLGINTQNENERIAILVGYLNTVSTPLIQMWITPSDKMKLRALYPFNEYFLSHKAGTIVSQSSKKPFYVNTLLSGVTNPTEEMRADGSKFISCQVNGVSKTYKLFYFYYAADTTFKQKYWMTQLITQTEYAQKQMNQGGAAQSSKSKIVPSVYLGVNIRNNDDCAYISYIDPNNVYGEGVKQLTPHSRAELRAIWPFYDYFEVLSKKTFTQNNPVAQSSDVGAKDYSDVPKSVTADPYLPSQQSTSVNYIWTFDDLNNYYPTGVAIRLSGGDNSGLISMEYVGYKDGVGSIWHYPGVGINSYTNDGMHFYNGEYVAVKSVNGVMKGTMLGNVMPDGMKNLRSENKAPKKVTDAKIKELIGGGVELTFKLDNIPKTCKMIHFYGGADTTKNSLDQDEYSCYQYMGLVPKGSFFWLGSAHLAINSSDKNEVYYVSSLSDDRGIIRTTRNQILSSSKFAFYYENSKTGMPQSNFNNQDIKVNDSVRFTKISLKKLGGTITLSCKKNGVDKTYRVIRYYMFPKIDRSFAKSLTGTDELPHLGLLGTGQYLAINNQDNNEILKFTVLVDGNFQGLEVYARRELDPSELYFENFKQEDDAK
jgi:hypothetical protein